MTGDPGCKAIFAARANMPADKFAAHVDRNAPLCECERHAVSDGPHGPVAPGEPLSRLIFSRDLQPDGTVAMHVFASWISKGFSVQRVSLAAAEEVARIVAARLGVLRSKLRSDVQWLGSADSDSTRIRRIARPDGAGAFCIYDTAEPENPAHAEVFQTIDPKDRSLRTKLKDDLARAFDIDRLPMPPTSCKARSQLFSASTNQIRGRPKNSRLRH